jgi:hypothetical protein
MKAEYEAAWPRFRSRQIWARVPPDVGAEIDAERARYAIRPSLSEVVGQLLSEALLWRKERRPRTSGAWKPPRGKPFQLP